MSLRQEYALGNSPYNAFLFAAVGEEKEGQPLTVLSALARLGLDPWKEAARLAALPREAAARAFAISIAMLPEGDWKVADSDAIAKRLVDSLPSGSTPIPAAPKATVAQIFSRKPDTPGNSQGSPPVYRHWLFWTALVVAGVLLAWQLQPDSNFEAAQSTISTQR